MCYVNQLNQAKVAALKSWNPWEEPQLVSSAYCTPSCLKPAVLYKSLDCHTYSSLIQIPPTWLRLKHINQTTVPSSYLPYHGMCAGHPIWWMPVHGGKRQRFSKVTHPKTSWKGLNSPPSPKEQTRFGPINPGPPPRCLVKLSAHGGRVVLGWSWSSPRTKSVFRCPKPL